MKLSGLVRQSIHPRVSEFLCFVFRLICEDLNAAADSRAHAHSNAHARTPAGDARFAEAVQTDGRTRVRATAAAAHD